MTPKDYNATDSLPQLTLRAVGRVHFGLWEISESAPHCFGGIGLMIEHSPVILYAGIASSAQFSSVDIDADDYWRPRIQSIIDRWLKFNDELSLSFIRVLESPAAHRGLGSGTQMACAVATLLLLDPHALSLLPRSLNEPHVPIWTLLSKPGKLTHDCTAADCMPEIAKIGQRGNRSNIGLHGFLEGGFIIDQGVRPGATGEDSPPRTTSRLAFPQWPVIVIHDVSAQGDSGQSEKEMFDRCSHTPNPHREEMISLVETEIARTVANEDWTRFDLAIGEYGRLAGKIFAPAQGGVYRTDRIAHTIETVKQLGISGATQSSWGPTVVAIAKDIEQAEWFQKRLQERLPHLMIEVVRAANHSAQAWVP